MREELPGRRAAETIKFDVARRGVNPVPYFATVGYYPDGRIGEVFLSSGKTGTDLQIATRDAAIALSFALQFGCPPDTIRRALSRDEDGSAEGPLGSLLDLLSARGGDGGPAAEATAPLPPPPPPSLSTSTSAMRQLLEATTEGEWE